MENQQVEIHDTVYNLVIDYKKEDKLRHSLNSLTEKIYGFSFENWYQSGYWEDRCIPYSLMVDGRVVSNILVSEIDFCVLGEKKLFVQLGIVMTDIDFENRGLSRFLMEKVLERYEGKCDMIYLFANDSVLDFYPKFSFVPVNEYQAVKTVVVQNKQPKARKIDVDNPEDLRLLKQLVENRIPVSQLNMLDSMGLILFYCKFFDLYYLQELEMIVVAKYNGDLLTIYDVYSCREVDMNQVIDILAIESTSNVILKFIPLNISDFDIVDAKEEDSTLFVQSKNRALFENNRLMFPILTHT